MSAEIIFAVSIVTLLGLAGITIYEVKRRKALAVEEAEQEKNRWLLHQHETWKTERVKNLVSDWFHETDLRDTFTTFINLPDAVTREKFVSQHFVEILAEDADRFSKLEGRKPLADEWFDVFMDEFLRVQHFELDWEAAYQKRGEVLEYEVAVGQSIADANSEYEKRAAEYWLERRKFEKERQETEREKQKQFDADMTAKRAHEQKRAHETISRKAAARREWFSLSSSERRAFRNCSQASKVKMLVARGHDYSTAVVFVSDFTSFIPDSSPAASGSSQGSRSDGAGDNGSVD